MTPLVLWLSYTSVKGHHITFPPFFTTHRYWTEGIMTSIKSNKFSTRLETKPQIVTGRKMT